MFFFFFFAIYIILVAGSLLEMYLIVQFIAHSTYDSSKKFQTEYSNFMKEISLEKCSIGMCTLKFSLNYDH